MTSKPWQGFLRGRAQSKCKASIPNRKAGRATCKSVIRPETELPNKSPRGRHPCRAGASVGMGRAGARGPWRHAGPAGARGGRGAGGGARRPAGASGARGRVAAGAGACVAREELEREEGGVREREEARIYLDLRVIIVCTNLKHWKVDMKKSCGRYIGFTGGLWGWACSEK